MTQKIMCIAPCTGVVMAQFIHEKTNHDYEWLRCTDYGLSGAWNTVGASMGISARDASSFFDAFYEYMYGTSASWEDIHGAMVAAVNDADIIIVAPAKISNQLSVYNKNDHMLAGFPADQWRKTDTVSNIGEYAFGRRHYRLNSGWHSLGGQNKHPLVQIPANLINEAFVREHGTGKRVIVMQNSAPAGGPVSDARKLLASGYSESDVGAVFNNSFNNVGEMISHNAPFDFLSDGADPYMDSPTTRRSLLNIATQNGCSTGEEVHEFFRSTDPSTVPALAEIVNRRSDFDDRYKISLPDPTSLGWPSHAELLDTTSCFVDNYKTHRLKYLTSYSTVFDVQFQASVLYDLLEIDHSDYDWSTINTMGMKSHSLDGIGYRFYDEIFGDMEIPMIGNNHMRADGHRFKGAKNWQVMLDFNDIDPRWHSDNVIYNSATIPPDQYKLSQEQYLISYVMRTWLEFHKPGRDMLDKVYNGELASFDLDGIISPEDYPKGLSYPYQ